MISALFFFGIPLAAAALAILMALRQREPRWSYVAAGVSTAALAVIIGAIIWFSNGCSDDADQCSAAAGWSLLGLDLILAIVLAVILVVGVRVARRRSGHASQSG